jgi:hypothetical protein
MSVAKSAEPDLLKRSDGAPSSTVTPLDHKMAAPNASLVRWVELAVVLVALLPFVSGQCYLMDSTAECAICWVTRNFGSDLATTKISE